MIKPLYFLSLLLLLASCSGGDKPPVVLTADQKSQIKQFGERLIATFNNHEHKVVNDSWSSLAFKKRITGLNKTQRSVLSHVFEKGVKDDIRYTNLLMINNLSKLGGKAYLSQVVHFDNYSELTMVMVFQQRYSFVKYRIELIQGKPYLSDLYDFRENTWYSEAVKNTINLNVRYDTFSKERGEANIAMRRANAAEKAGDAEGALYWLYEIPQTHWVGNGLSIRRLNLAVALGDTTYAGVLNKEFEYNQSTYLQYLYYSAYGDEAQLNKVYTRLRELTGGGEKLDSLIGDNNDWN